MTNPPKPTAPVRAYISRAGFAILERDYTTKQNGDFEIIVHTPESLEEFARKVIEMARESILQEQEIPGPYGGISVFSKYICKSPDQIIAALKKDGDL